MRTTEEKKAYKKQYDANNKDRAKKRFRKFDLKRKFNLSEEQYKLMFDNQDGKCAICGKHQNEFKQALAVDHSHVTGKIRGLLCFKCNRGLGCFNDNVNDIEKAITYLNSHNIL
jgi:hypothetical protein